MLDGSRIGEILVRTGSITPEAVDKALAIQGERGGRIGEILVNQKLVTEHQVFDALVTQFGYPVLDRIDGDALDVSLVAPLSLSYARQHVILPLRREEGVLDVATGDPTDVGAIDDLRALFGGAEIVLSMATPDVLIPAINRAFDRRARADQVVGDLEQEEGIADIAHELEDAGQDILDEADEAPIIRLVNSVLNQAAKEQASDIHIEPMEKAVIIRFRKDGVLHEIVRAPKRVQPSITSRVKIMGGLNIAEKRLPQDGRIRIKVAGRDIDIRLSTVPTSHGERLVLRLLDKTATTLDLSVLGMHADTLDLIEKLIHRPNGIMLCCGPTGSGKTTTLYSALSRINRPDLNILTVEDPVEYQLAGVGQMQVNPKIHFTFASGLRAILRQDPDVVLVGEIRDLETAEIAVQASLTGHLVLSTVHTNDAASTFTRLTDMGVEPFLIASSVIGILAQRLIRTLCKACKEPHVPTPVELEQLAIDPGDARLKKATFMKARGCSICSNTGYKGRSGIHELLTPTEEIKSLVVRKCDAFAIKKQALDEGMVTLREDGARKCMAGMTTVEEIMRVTAEDAS